MVTILAIVPSAGYSPTIIKIIKDVVDMQSKTLYVSLNKTYRSLLRQFKDNDIDTKAFSFVDAITPTIFYPKPDPQCHFVPLKEDLDKFRETIMKITKDENISLVIFDSVSTLTTYNKTDEIIQLVGELIVGFSSINCSAVFFGLESDENTKLIEHIRMRVDKTIEFNRKGIAT